MECRLRAVCLIAFMRLSNANTLVAPPRPRGLICRQYDKVFEAADTNRDGLVDEREVYEMVLKVCITLNRQAPINPPSSEAVMAVYRESDKDRDGKLNKKEFQLLAATVFIGGIGRVLAHKLISLLVSPLLAAEIVRQLDGLPWLVTIGKRLVPSTLHAKVLNRRFCQTALTVAFVAFLGSWVLNLLDMLGNAWYGVVQPSRVPQGSSATGQLQPRRLLHLLRGARLSSSSCVRPALGGAKRAKS